MSQEKVKITLNYTTKMSIIVQYHHGFYSIRNIIPLPENKNNVSLKDAWVGTWHCEGKTKKQFNFIASRESSNKSN